MQISKQTYSNAIVPVPNSFQAMFKVFFTASSPNLALARIGGYFLESHTAGGFPVCFQIP